MTVDSLAAGFLRSALTAPDRPALEIGNRRWTYGELATIAWSGSTKVAASRRAPIVALLAHRSITAYAGALAILLARRGYVPLHPKHPPKRNARLLKLSGAKAVLVGDEGMAAWEAMKREPELADTQLVRLDPHILRRDGEKPDQIPFHVEPDAVAYLLFTSGSTGAPKGVAVTHASAAAYFATVRDRYRIHPDDRLSGFYDMTFDPSVHDLFLCWDGGACLVPVPDEAKLSPVEFIRERALTGWYSGPSVLRSLLRLRALRPGLFPTLRLSLFGGEPLPLAAALAWQEAAPNSIIENVYGPTETTIAITAHRFSKETARRAVNGNVPIGELFPNHGHSLIDENGKRVEPGPEGYAVGELVVSGPQVTDGYSGDEEKTGEHFRNDAKGRRWYRTGDRVRRDADGCFHFLGRVDDQVKVNGFRAELVEIEHVLRRAAGTTDVAAIAWPVEDGVAKGVIGFVAAASIDEGALSRACAEQLPPALVPRRILAIAELPVNTNGKIDRAALAKVAERQKIEEAA